MDRLHINEGEAMTFKKNKKETCELCIYLKDYTEDYCTLWEREVTKDEEACYLYV